MVARVEEEMKYHGGMVVKHGQWWSVVLEIESRMLCCTSLVVPDRATLSEGWGEVMALHREREWL